MKRPATSGAAMCFAFNAGLQIAPTAPGNHFSKRETPQTDLGGFG
jgi:hypothetical protein